MVDRMSDVNVEVIMREIRNDIRRKGFTEEMLSFDDVEGRDPYLTLDFNIDELKDTIEQLQGNNVVSWKVDSVGHGIKGLVKRIIRKTVGFVVAQAMDAQNMYNRNVANAFMEVQEYIDSQNRLTNQYRKRICELQDRVEELERLIGECNER